MKFFQWPRKISWKLTMVYTVIFIIVIIVLNGGVYFFLSNFVEDNARDGIDNTLQFVLPKLSSIEGGLDPDDAEFLQDISRTEGNIYFRVLDYKQDVVAQSSVLQGMDIPIMQGYGYLNKGDRRFITKSVVISNFGFLIGYFQIAREVTLEYRFLGKLLTLLIITGLIGMFAAIIAGYTVTRKTLKPVKQMTDTARSISISDLGQRLKIEGPEDELTNLGQTFNSMLDRLEKSFKRQQQFVSDASHELRTPISVIQGYINLLDRWGKNEEDIRDEAIVTIKTEVQNMKSLVERLLFLARGESDNLDIKKVKFRVDDLVQEMIRETSVLARDCVKIKNRVLDQVKFYGDRKMIKQMLRIFVDNSLKYTPEGGEISIDVQDLGDEFSLSVCDTGRGIPEEDLPHIFKRFYRVDKSRSEKNGGTGLGLAIARWIIDIHEGSVDVESSLGEGTKIEIVFPKK